MLALDRHLERDRLRHDRALVLTAAVWVHQDLVHRDQVDQEVQVDLLQEEETRN